MSSIGRNNPKDLDLGSRGSRFQPVSALTSSTAPRLLPLTVTLSVLLWFFVTTGGHQIFVSEVLGEAYDSQAEHFLRGNVDVDGEAIRHEAFVVDGRARMYQGPFPAFLRIPLNFIYPEARGKWSRISGFAAGVIALSAFAGLIGQSLRSSPLSPRSRNWLGNSCIAGFALATPLLLLLGNVSIYNEAIGWGLASSLAALFFACRSRNAEGPALTRALFGFSCCAGAALLSRITFGLPFLFIAPLLGLRLPRENRWKRLAVLALPLGASLAFYLLLSYARFHSFMGVNFDYYINSPQREFAQKFGFFNLRRIPYGLADYFGLRLPAFEWHPPFLRAARHYYPHPLHYSLPFSETYLPVPWCSAWLLFGALLGIAFLFRPGKSEGFDRWMAAALVLQCVCILSLFSLAERYAADLYPFLIFCLLIFLRLGGPVLLRVRHIIIGLVAFSIVVNSLTTLSWLVDVDQNVPEQTRTSWKLIMGREVPAERGH